MKDYYQLQPDRVRLMNKHFTPGRAGHKIDMVVVHHNAGILSIDQIWQVWQDRAASAHYQVTSTGEVGQLVWDRDTAWHAANSTINRRSIGLEISNSAGAAADWPISNEAIMEGARVTAAICHHYRLGRPESGKNVRYHQEFTGTSCPHHLAPGGKYNGKFMQEAQRFYDALAAKTVNPDGTPKAPPQPAKEEGFLMSLTDDEQRELLDKTRRIHHELTHRFQSRYPGSEFRDTMIGYVLELDRKVEDGHANMLPAIWAKLGEVRDYLAGITKGRK